ncbi:hypothetical protein [Sporomusa sphaeroides]|uniref:HTH merR-type domain-containing protein n=1 Tax=Sporomusa sphaeroides DSM 2875 TaxID=1337886 RepID=A0ABM9W0W2_9FIRM|nr:hypothetical protein [Sporomusa sphaeroides]OLS56812.1 hypothetical protein SPSPH_03020 [Sporomusa sphaeroides DSM 2875]CVK18759.1 hypothetical protein SSPH_01403 [Sporomusa sphaeroides DSM 2875]
MTPDELIEKVQPLRVKIKRRSLLNYEKNGFIDKPLRGGNGRGKGRTTEYHEKAWLDVYIAYRILHEHKIPAPYIAAAFKKRNKLPNLDCNDDAILDANVLWLTYYCAGLIGIPCGRRVKLVMQQHAHSFFEWLYQSGNSEFGNTDGDTLIVIQNDGLYEHSESYYGLKFQALVLDEKDGEWKKIPLPGEIMA